MFGKWLARGVVFACFLPLMVFAAEPARNINIPAGPLVPALESLTKQVGVDLIYQPRQLAQYRTAGISGLYSPQDAVQILLQGTPLIVRVDQSGAMVIAVSGLSETAAETTQPGSGPVSDAAATPASDAGAQTAPTSAPAGEGQLAEVVVTAEIRQESAQSTPISMSVVAGTDLQARHDIDLSDMQTVTPNLTVSGGNVNIRGVGLNAGVAGITPGVAILRDGLLEDEGVGPSVTGVLYDIQNVSVLKGPQGTFIGASAIGGAIEVTSQNPQFGSSMTGYVDAQLGNYSDENIDGAINTPLTDTFAARLAFNYEDRGSFYRDIGELPLANTPYTTVDSNLLIGSDPGHTDNKEARIGFLWKPSDSFQALLKISDDQMNSGGSASQVDPYPIVNPITGTVTHAPYYSTSVQAPWLINEYLAAQTNYVYGQVADLQLMYTLPDQIQLRSVTGYQNNGATSYTPTTAYTYTNTGYAERGTAPDVYKSQEFDIISPTTWRVSFVAGGSLFYRRTDQDNASVSYQFSQALPLYQTEPNGDFGAVQRIMGIYGNVDWQITDTLQLAVGGRENWDNNFNFGTYDEVNELSGTTQEFYNIGYYKDAVPTGKAGLNWTPIPNQLVYAFVAKGYKSGALSTGSTVEGKVQTAGPETDVDYEVGWKGSLLNDHLQTDFGGFYMNYAHMQESIWNPDTGLTALTNLTGPSKMYGLEGELRGNLSDFIVDLSGAYTHSAMGTLRAIDQAYLPATANGEAQCQAGQVPPACFNYNAVGPTGQGYYATVSGEPNPVSPLYSLAATVGYDYHAGNGVLTPELTWEYVASTYSSIFEIPYYYEPPHGTLDTMLTYAHGPWQVEAWGKNVFDRYWGYLTVAPRTFGLRVHRSF